MSSCSPNLDLPFNPSASPQIPFEACGTLPLPFCAFFNERNTQNKIEELEHCRRYLETELVLLRVYSARLLKQEISPILKPHLNRKLYLILDPNLRPLFSFKPFTVALHYPQRLKYGSTIKQIHYNWSASYLQFYKHLRDVKEGLTNQMEESRRLQTSFSEFLAKTESVQLGRKPTKKEGSVKPKLKRLVEVMQRKCALYQICLHSIDGEQEAAKKMLSLWGRKVIRGLSQYGPLVLQWGSIEIGACEFSGENQTVGEHYRRWYKSHAALINANQVYDIKTLQGSVKKFGQVSKQWQEVYRLCRYAVPKQLHQSVMHQIQSIAKHAQLRLVLYELFLNTRNNLDKLVGKTLQEYGQCVWADLNPEAPPNRINIRFKLEGQNGKYKDCFQLFLPCLAVTSETLCSTNEELIDQVNKQGNKETLLKKYSEEQTKKSGILQRVRQILALLREDMQIPEDAESKQ